MKISEGRMSTSLLIQRNQMPSGVCLIYYALKPNILFAFYRNLLETENTNKQKKYFTILLIVITAANLHLKDNQLPLGSINKEYFLICKTLQRGGNTYKRIKIKRIR